MTECSVLRINTSTPTVWLHWPTCRPSSDVCTSTLPSASSGEGKKHNYRCLDITGFIVINSRVFFLTRCWFQIKPKPKPYWSIWTKSLPRSNWNLQLNIDLPSLFWFALQPQIATTSVLLQKPQSAEKKKTLGPNVYYLHTLFAEGAFFPPYDSLYKRRQECISVRLEAQPRRYTVYHSSESRAETLLTACMWKMSLHTTGNDVRDEPKFLFHLLKSTAPLVCIISSWCVFPFY